MKLFEFLNHVSPKINLRLLHFGAVITVGSICYLLIFIRWKKFFGLFLTSSFSLYMPETVSDSNSKLLIHKSNVCNNKNCLIYAKPFWWNIIIEVIPCILFGCFSRPKIFIHKSSKLRWTLYISIYKYVPSGYLHMTIINT